MGDLCVFFIEFFAFLTGFLRTVVVGVPANVSTVVGVSALLAVLLLLSFLLLLAILLL
jgi:hypothetical protein